MLTDAHLGELQRAMTRRTGVVLDAQRAALIEMRLMPIARRSGMTNAAELIAAAQMRPDDPYWDAMCDALLNAETSFFRDRAPFATLIDAVAPAMLRESGADSLRIWSAGCGTGQEAFSIAMALHEARDAGRIGDFEIIATDASERLLDRARKGEYTQFEAQRGLSIRRLIQHFERAGDHWRISDRLRARVRFINHNLLTEAPQWGAFDVVFCRNVLSEFSADARADALENIAGAVKPGGALFIGQGETIAGGMRAFAPSRVHHGVFERTQPAMEAA
ncbi:MAG: methyltransferase [Alphaproteobacteria bacterium]|nr:methyltransferase [Alphaproteobacteria bacterium]